MVPRYSNAVIRRKFRSMSPATFIAADDDSNALMCTADPALTVSLTACQPYVIVYTLLTLLEQ